MRGKRSVEALLLSVSRSAVWRWRQSGVHTPGFDVNASQELHFPAHTTTDESLCVCPSCCVHKFIRAFVLLLVHLVTLTSRQAHARGRGESLDFALPKFPFSSFCKVGSVMPAHSSLSAASCCSAPLPLVVFLSPSMLGLPVSAAAACLFVSRFAFLETLSGLVFLASQ
ncbi:putative transmembrane protein [Toxoplasma gondii FOU]|uniref:Putative transmembrane protein n=1 Tax=Toxoplasma gondii FOU TaxID=943167 RepID=A0A086LHG0_TOXGO|nr:putative transmembrane protein [Toxoplasma gondii FOU]